RADWHSIAWIPPILAGEDRPWDEEPGAYEAWLDLVRASARKLPAPRVPARRVRAPASTTRVIHHELCASGTFELAQDALAAAVTQALATVEYADSLQIFFPESRAWAASVGCTTDDLFGRIGMSLAATIDPASIGGALEAVRTMRRLRCGAIVG